jgi:phage-related minor tail protein
MASEFDLGSYRAEIILDDSQFESGMNNAESQIESTDKKAQGFGKNLGALAAGAVAGLAVALGGAAIAGVTMADDLQKSLNKLQTQTGMTEDEMKGLDDSIKNIYNANLGENFQDIADAMANVKQNTGFVGKELEDATKTALTMRDTFGFDVNESMRTVSAMMKNFGITSEEAFTLLAQGQQMGVNASDDMLDTFLEYSPLFQQLGFDAEGMLDVLNTGMQAGVRNSDVLADTVKEFGIRVKDGSKLTAESFLGLGLNADGMANKFAQGGDSAQEAFSQTMSALSKIEDPVKRNTIGVGLFGTKFEDLEADAVLALGNVSSEANMSGDTLAKINEIKFNTFGEAMQGIGRNLNTGILVPLGELVLPILNKFTNWIMEQMPVIQGVFSNVFGAIEIVVSKVHTFFVDNILPIFQKAGQDVSTIFPVVKEVFENVFNAIVAVGTTLWNFFKNNILPIFMSLYQWISGNMPTIRATFEVVFSKIVEVARGVWTFFQNNILPILSRLFEFIQSKMPQIQSIVEKVFGIIAKVVQVAWDIFENLLLPVLKKLWDWVSPYIPKIQGIIEKAFGIIFDAVDVVVGVFDDVVDAVKKAIDWLTFWDDKKVKKKTIEVEERRTSSGGKTPAYAVGTPFVPNDQLALIHKGEAIIPAKYNPFNKNTKSVGLASSNVDNSKTYNLGTVNIKANNPMEFFQGLDNALRSQ